MINPIRRAPLVDRSNISFRSDRPDKAIHRDKTDKDEKSEKPYRHPSTYQENAVSGTNKQAMEEWWSLEVESTTPIVSPREMEMALKESLSENRKVHELCGKLLRENEELKAKVRELAVVSMLYDATKDELEAVRKELEQRDQRVSNGKNVTPIPHLESTRTMPTPDLSK